MDIGVCRLVLSLEEVDVAQGLGSGQDLGGAGGEQDKGWDLGLWRRRGLGGLGQGACLEVQVVPLIVPRGWTHI